MADTPTVNIEAHRWVPCVRWLPIVDTDLTGAEFQAQVRAYADQAGPPLVGLVSANSPADEGIMLDSVTDAKVSDHVAAGRLQSGDLADRAVNEVVKVSLVRLYIREDTMERLASQQRPGDATFYWDLQVTPLDGYKDVYVQGQFTVLAGVTQ